MKISARIFLIVTGILLLSHYLPAGYWLLAEKQQRAPYVYYSCISNRFLFYRFGVGEPLRVDSDGKVYDRDEFEQLLPLDNYSQLLRDGKMPKTVNGIPIAVEKLRRERINLRVKPVMFDGPGVDLYPLLEAESGRVRLELPPDFMRLGKSVEFIDAKSNTLLAEKSAKFLEAFKAQGFVFPATIVGGNPSTMKPYDEGYFIADNQGSVFHLRQVQGAPVLKRVSDVVKPEEKARWTSLKPRFIQVQEQDNHEVRAVIIDQGGQANIVVGPDYRLVTVPLKDYNPTTMVLNMRGDLLNRLATVSSEHHLEAIVMNRNYDLVDRHSEPLRERRETTAGKIAGALFPFTLEFEDKNSGYIGFYAQPGNAMMWIVNGSLLLILTGWILFRKQRLPARWLDLLAVATTGLFGFVLVWLIPRSE